jgi:transcriptional regulator with XRE-family HTH domain
LRATAAAPEVGRLIATLRQRLGRSQIAFARQVGISRNALVAYERGGRVPKSASLGRIAEAGGVSVDWLLGRDGAGPKTNERLRGDRAWEAAIEVLRMLWMDPRRRRVALDVLLALSQAPRDGLRRRL